MNRLCLDTSAYSHYKRGHRAVVEVIVRAREVYVPAIVLGELRAGFRWGDHADRDESDLLEFLAQPVVSVLEVDDDAASHYADLVCGLRRAGTPLPTNDVWIGAIAARQGATVLTYDRHFEAMTTVGKLVLAT